MGASSVYLEENWKKGRESHRQKESLCSTRYGVRTHRSQVHGMSQYTPVCISFIPGVCLEQYEGIKSKSYVSFPPRARTRKKNNMNEQKQGHTTPPAPFPPILFPVPAREEKNSAGGYPKLTADACREASLSSAS
jgi:hypothetical protein